MFKLAVAKQPCIRIPSGQNRQKHSLKECVFFNSALKIQCIFGDFAHWVFSYIFTHLCRYTVPLAIKGNVKIRLPIVQLPDCPLPATQISTGHIRSRKPRGRTTMSRPRKSTACAFNLSLPSSLLTLISENALKKIVTMVYN